MKRLVYLDNAATTYPKPESVYLALDDANRNLAVNAGRSSYALARTANEIIISTKQLLLQLVNSKKGKVIFTPSATIALNEIIAGLNINANQVVYVSPFEHNAVMRPLYYYSKINNFKIKVLPYNENFILDVDQIEYMFLREKPDYVFLSHISNVTGYILEIEKITKCSKKYNSTVIIDASQSMGLIPIDLEKLDADFLVFAGHKTLYGPFGIGGYINNSNITLQPLLYGGTGLDSLNLELVHNSHEVGSPNIVSIAGLNAALKWLQVDKIERKKKQLTQKLINELKEIYDIELFLPEDKDKHIGIVSFIHRNYRAEEVGEILDEDFNIAVRTGFHCAPLIHDLLKSKHIGGTIRCSLGYFNTEEDIDYFIKCMNEL